MIKKEDRSKKLQKALDEKEYHISYNFINSIKGVDANWKLLLNLMCNDLYMNGTVQWAQKTYADKLGITRQSVNNSFKKLIEVGVLIPEKENRAGVKGKYGIDISKITNLKRVKQDVPTCKAHLTEPVKQDVPTCKEGFTYNKSNKDNKSLLDEEDDLSSSSSMGTQETDIEKVLSIDLSDI